MARRWWLTRESRDARWMVLGSDEEVDVARSNEWEVVNVEEVVVQAVGAAWTVGSDVLPGRRWDLDEHRWEVRGVRYAFGPDDPGEGTFVELVLLDSSLDPRTMHVREIPEPELRAKGTAVSA